MCWLCHQMVIGFRYTIPHYELMAVYIWWQDPCKGLVNWLWDCLHHSRSPLNKKFYDIIQQLRQVKRTWKCNVFDQRLFNCYRVSFILKFWKFESKKFRILIELVLLFIVITQKVSYILCNQFLTDFMQTTLYVNIIIVV